MFPSAGRYASQPSMFPQNNFNRFSTLMGGFRPGTSLAGAAQNAQQNPNPAAHPATPKTGLATAAGVQQLAQKAAELLLNGAHADTAPDLVSVLLGRVKRSEVQNTAAGSPSAGTSLGGNSGSSSTSSAPSSSSFGTGPAQAPNAQKAQQNPQNGMGMGGGMNPGVNQGGVFNGNQVGAFGIVRPGWPSLGQPAMKSASQNRQKQSSALPPTPGLTANQPAPPQPGMPQQTPPGMPPMAPPNGGAPIPGGPGQPSIDPSTGQPPPGDPTAAAQQQQMAQQQAQQPQQPPAPVDPLTGQPVSSPMQDPPPPTLPANPRMTPPRAANASDHAMQGVLGTQDGPGGGTGSGLMGDKAMADVPQGAGDAVEDMRSEAMAMGSKTAALKSAFYASVVRRNLGASLFQRNLAGELGEKLAAMHKTALPGQPSPNVRVNQLPDTIGPKPPAFGRPGPNDVPIGYERRPGGQLRPGMVPSTPYPPRPGSTVGGGTRGLVASRDLAQQQAAPRPNQYVVGRGGVQPVYDAQVIPRANSPMSLDAAGASPRLPQPMWRQVTPRPQPGGFLQSAARLAGRNPRLAGLAGGATLGAGLLGAAGLGAGIGAMAKRGSFEKAAVDITLSDGTNLGDHESLAEKLASRLWAAAKDNPDTVLLHTALAKRMIGLAEKGAAWKCRGCGEPMSQSCACKRKEGRVKSAGCFLGSRPSDSVSNSPARSACGESEGISYTDKADQYAQGKAAWDSVSTYFKGHSKRVEQPDPFAGKHSAKTAGLWDRVMGAVPRLNAHARNHLPAGYGGPTPRVHPVSLQTPRTPQEMNLQAAIRENPRDLSRTQAYRDFLAAPDRPVREQMVNKVNRIAAEGAPIERRQINPSTAVEFDPLENFHGALAARLSQAQGVLDGTRRWFHGPRSLDRVLEKTRDTTVDNSINAAWNRADRQNNMARGIIGLGGAGALGTGGYAAYNALNKQGAEKTAGLWDTVGKGALNAGQKYLPGATNFARGLFNAAKTPTPNFVPPAAGSGFKGFSQATNAFQKQVADRTAETGTRGFRAGSGIRNFGQAAAPQLGSAAGGAFTGGIAGDDMGLGGPSINGPLGMKFNLAGAGLGAIAGNRGFQNFARRPGAGRGALDVAGAGIRRAGIGGFAGSAADTVLDQTNIRPMTDAEGNPINRVRLGQIGAWGGLGLGAAGRGAQRALANTAGGAANNQGLYRQFLGAAAGGEQQLANGMSNFTRGTFDPLVGGAKALVRKPIEWAGGTAPQMFQRSTAPLSRAQIAGRIGGGAGLAAAGIGLGNEMVNSKVQGMVDDNVARVYGEAMPQVQQDFGNMLNSYLGQRGMLDGNGQFQMPGGGIMGNLGRGGDSVFRSLGMDPAAMSPLQKMMILGGAGIGGAGAMTGNAPLMAGGGLATAAGLLPLLSQPNRRAQAGGGSQGGAAGLNYAGQPNQPQARNEWLYQQQGG